MLRILRMLSCGIHVHVHLLVLSTAGMPANRPVSENPFALGSVRERWRCDPFYIFLWHASMPCGAGDQRTPWPAVLIGRCAMRSFCYIDISHCGSWYTVVLPSPWQGRAAASQYDSRPAGPVVWQCWRSKGPVRLLVPLRERRPCPVEVLWNAVTRALCIRTYAAL